MNLCEALRTGRPIRRKSSPRIVGPFGEGYVDPRYFADRMGVTWADLTADDWEVQEEPKPKVKRAQYLVIPLGDDAPFQTTDFYKDDIEARLLNEDWEIIRLTETEREFER